MFGLKLWNKVNDKLEDGRDRYSEKEKEKLRKENMSNIKGFIVLIILMFLSSYFFGDGNIDSSSLSDGNYRRP